MTYEVYLSTAARRALTHTLPETVAAAVHEFLSGPLTENPHQVGRPLRGPFEGFHSARRGSYRILNQINDEQIIVNVIKIDHRRDVYRP